MKDIVVSTISYRIKNKTILNQVSLTVEQGDSFALLGENGSGKSTLIDIILNDLKPSSGHVYFFENPITSFDGIGVLYDHLPLFPMLTVAESIHYFSTIYGLSYEKIETRYFDIFDIHKIQKTLIRELSQGEKKRVGILLSIMHNPKLLLLDEPFANLDPTIIERIWKMIQTPKRTVFFTTHDWKKAEKQATKIAFIYNGQIVGQPQSPKQILQALPASQKVIISNTDDATQKLNDYTYYISDGNVHIFFDQQSNLLDTIRSFTNNFSVQNVDLQDAYLFHINQTSS
jgi:ABC-2 type transport system ATP-binding protein